MPYALAGFFVSVSFGILARDAGMPAAAAIAGVLALALVPVAPAGIPVLAASLAALLGLRSRLR